MSTFQVQSLSFSPGIVVSLGVILFSAPSMAQVTDPNRITAALSAVQNSNSVHNVAPNSDFNLFTPTIPVPDVSSVQPNELEAFTDADRAIIAKIRTNETLTTEEKMRANEIIQQVAMKRINYRQTYQAEKFTSEELAALSDHDRAVAVKFNRALDEDDDGNQVRFTKPEEKKLIAIIRRVKNYAVK